MSNLTALLHDRRLSPRVDDWLRRHSESSEIHTVSRGRSRLVLVSRQVARGVSGSSFYRGVKSTRETLAFRSSPPVAEATGTFVEVDWGRDDEVTVRRDLYGNFRLLATAGDGFSATSDSLLVLASLRRSLLAPLQLDEESLWARSILTLAAAQQMSDRTLFEQVRFVPTGRNLRLTSPRRGRGAWLRRTGRDYDYEPTPREVDLLGATREDHTYVELLRGAAGAMAGGLRALDRLSWTTELALSGGQDSRAVLAAAHRVGADVLCRTAGGGAEPSVDYTVAESLAATFGFRFMVRADDEPVEETTVQDRLALWGATLAGAYDGFGTTRSVPWYRTRTMIGGMGASVAKGMWGWTSWNAYAATVTSPSKHNTPRGVDAFVAAGRRGLQAAGFDADDPIGAQLHFVAYRSGLHASAGQVGCTVSNLSPLQTPELTRAGAIERTDRLITDLTLLLCPPMVSHAYDRAERVLPPAAAERRLGELGGPLEDDEIPEVRQHGGVDEIVQGPSRLGLSIARDLELVGDWSDAAGWIETDLDLVPDDLRPVYREIAANGRWRARTAHGGNLWAAGPSVPKAAALRLLRLCD